MFDTQCTLTQDGQDHAIFQNLQGARADKVVGLESISVAYEVFPGCTERGLDVQGEGAQTPSAGVLEHRQLQDVFVQVHGDVRSQLIWEVMQQLRNKTGTLLHFFRTYKMLSPFLYLSVCFPTMQAFSQNYHKHP